MSTGHTQEHAVALLQDLGLKEYEARCFVALTRLPAAKAREIGEAADVPRTRVYDAVEQLGEYGLVEIQHSSPKRFRAIAVEEALAILREDFERRFSELGRSLESLEPIGDGESGPHPPGVWTLSGIETIRAQARELVSDGSEEVVYLVGSETVLSDDLLGEMRAVSEADVPVYVGTVSDRLFEEIAGEIPDVQRFESWIDWLWTPSEDGSWTLGQILVVDRRAVLVSAHRTDTYGQSEDTAVWTSGVGNGLGMVAERLLSAGIEQTSGDTYKQR